MGKVNVPRSLRAIRRGVEDDYIQSLQQQIQILELEAQLRGSVWDDSALQASVNPPPPGMDALQPIEGTLQQVRAHYEKMRVAAEGELATLQREHTALREEHQKQSALLRESKASAVTAAERAAEERRAGEAARDAAVAEAQGWEARCRALEAEVRRAEASYSRVLVDRDRCAQDLLRTKQRLDSARGDVSRWE